MMSVLIASLQADEDEGAQHTRKDAELERSISKHQLLLQNCHRTRHAPRSTKLNITMATENHDIRKTSKDTGQTRLAGIPRSDWRACPETTEMGL